MRTYRPRAYAQGELDNLCGLYAVINGLRHAIQPERRLSGHDYLWLFQELIHKLAESNELDDVISNGFSRKQVDTLLKASQTIALERWGQFVEVERPFRKERPPRKASVVEAIRQHQRKRGRSVILQFSEHWSVVKRVTETRFDLLDSYEYRRLRIDELRIGVPITPTDDANWYWLSPASVFLVSANGKW